MQRLSFAAFLATFLPLAGLADTSQISGICPGLDVTATAPEAGLHDLICRTATDHVARLSACGILPTRRISVTAAPVFEGLPANCVGAFHCERDEIETVSPETLASRDAPGFIYKGLKPEAAFVSILRHELTHALLEHTSEDSPISSAAHEYIAFALQIEAMTDDERAAFLETNGRIAAMSLDTFNMVIYSFVPGRFASSVWLHCSTPENGCRFVRDLIEGRVVLGTPLHFP